MEVILLERVDNLGGIGDKVKVKPGYGRNYLIPQGKATLATQANLAVFEERRAELEAKAEAELTAAKERAAAVEALELTIPTKVGAEGKLFGSVGPIDIADAFEKVQVEVERSEIRMPEGPIQELGEFTIGVHLHPEVDVDINVRVVESE